MAVLTADTHRPFRPDQGGKITYRELPLAGYTNFGGGTTAHDVHKGSIVVCDVSDTDGYFRAAPLTSGTAAATGDMLGGIAVESASVTSSDTADGSVNVRVAINGEWGFAKGALAVTDVGAIAYASDDNTITTTSSNNFAVGRIVEVDDTYVWVRISDYVMVPLS